MISSQIPHNLLQIFWKIWCDSSGFFNLFATLTRFFYTTSQILEQNLSAATEWLKCYCKGETQQTSKHFELLLNESERHQVSKLLDWACSFILPFSAILRIVDEMLLKLWMANRFTCICKLYSSLHSSTAYSLPHNSTIFRMLEFSNLFPAYLWSNMKLKTRWFLDFLSSILMRSCLNDSIRTFYLNSFRLNITLALRLVIFETMLS